MATSLGGWFDKVFFDAHGEPCASGELRFYQTGTDIPQGVATFDGTPLGAVIRLDDDGRPESDFRFYTDKIYRVVVVDADGVVVKTIDGVAIPEGDGGAMYNPMTAEGDLIVGATDGEPVRLGIGTSGKILTSNGTTATWEYPATQPGDHKVLTASGDSYPGYLKDKIFGDGDAIRETTIDTPDGEGGYDKQIEIGVDATGRAAGKCIMADGAGNYSWETPTGDHQLLVSATDAAAGYLGAKLTAGSNVTLTPQTDGDGVQTLEISATGGGGGGGSAWTHISTLSSHYKQSSAAYVNVYFYFNPLGPTVRSILIPYAHFSYSKNVTAKIAVWKCGAFNGGVSLGTPIAAKTFTQAIKHPLTWFDFDADVDVSDKTANYIFGYSTNSPDNGYVRIICDDSSADNNFGLVSYQMKSNNSWDSSYPLWYGGKQSMAFGLSSAAQNS